MPNHSDTDSKSHKQGEIPGGRSNVPADLADLKKKSVRGGAVTVVSQAVGIGIHMISIVVLARLLSPEDYGIIAMVSAVTAFAGLFSDLGLSAAAIQKGNITPAQQSNLFWLNVLLGTILTSVVAAASPLVAAFYQKQELVPVTIALSVSFIIGSIGSQHGAMLTRRMQFARKSAAALTGSVISLCISAPLAWNGFSYWSLVIGSLSGGVCTTLLLITLSPFRPGLPNRGSGIREMAKFGAHITGFNFVNYFHRNLDNILIGRFWGTAALGEYSRAYSILMFPIQAIRGPINAVAYPAMCKLQSEPKSFRRYYRQVSSLIAFASMPITALLFVSAEQIVELLLGAQWNRVAPLFSVLAMVCFIQPTASLRGLVLMSQGKSKKYLVWGVINAALMSVAFVIGVHWGAIGVAYAYAIATYAVLQPSMFYVFGGTPVTSGDFWRSVVRPGCCSILACLIVILAKQCRPIFDPVVVEIGFNSIVFCIAYLLAYLVAPGGREDLVAKVSLFQSLSSRRKVSLPSAANT